MEHTWRCSTQRKLPTETYTVHGRMENDEEIQEDGNKGSEEKVARMKGLKREKGDQKRRGETRDGEIVTCTGHWQPMDIGESLERRRLSIPTPIYQNHPLCPAPGLALSMGNYFLFNNRGTEFHGVRGSFHALQSPKSFCGSFFNPMTWQRSIGIYQASLSLQLLHNNRAFFTHQFSLDPSLLKEKENEKHLTISNQKKPQNIFPNLLAN